eukprot:TRINITY_DN1311_c0_g1_i4.p1 TRINITY_DN1311_c0_g1~~TRINITY_DN1311_c0_g1_i4.p1  ORF type:complete len:364 (+),score=65.51 TRINITY_DN1311_c0_g1_i4:482-1573(+)
MPDSKPLKALSHATHHPLPHHPHRNRATKPRNDEPKSVPTKSPIHPNHPNTPTFPRTAITRETFQQSTNISYVTPTTMQSTSHLSADRLLNLNSVQMESRRFSTSDAGISSKSSDTSLEDDSSSVSSSTSSSNSESSSSVESLLFVAETLLPTTTGHYRVRAYRNTLDYTEPIAMIYGDIENGENIPVRVHDACFTSEVIGSLKCDCKLQLDFAMTYIREQGPGMVIYLPQEGRGIGLANKIAAYHVQEGGVDTVDANRMLGLPDDCREYAVVSEILSDLNIKSIQLLTNNPRKINKLTDLGIEITGRIPVIMETNEYSKLYLDAKAKRMAHMIETEQETIKQDLASLTVEDDDEQLVKDEEE